MKTQGLRLQKRNLLLAAMVCVLAFAPACSEWIEENTSSGGGEATLTASATGDLDADTLKRIKGLYTGNAEVTISGKGIGSSIKVTEKVALSANIAEDGTVTISDGDQLNTTVKLEGTTYVVTGIIHTDSCKDVSITTHGNVGDGQITGTVSGSGKCGTGPVRVPVAVSGHYLLIRETARSLKPVKPGLTWTQIFEKVVVE